MWRGRREKCGKEQEELEMWKRVKSWKKVTTRGRKTNQRGRGRKKEDK